ncbi:MAG: site-specific integrase [Lachnospiraceae bacterium]|nr:site-specific integrase [Lachnospiraceae bacterium]
MPRKGENIRKRADGRWEGRFQAWDEKRNRKVSKSIYAKSYTEAKEKLAAAKVVQQQNIHGLGWKESLSGILLADYEKIASEWLEDIKQCRKYSTYVKYEQIYEKHLRGIFSNFNTTNISMKQIAQSLSGINCSSQSMMKSIFSVANQILKFAHEHYGSPYHRLSPSKEHSAPKTIEILTRAEQIRFLGELCDDMDSEERNYRLGILLCLYTGLRLGEICALKWNDIDLDGGLLYVKRTVQRIKTDGKEAGTFLREDDPKSMTSKREIPLPEAILALLKSRYSDDEYVISGDCPTEPRTMYNHYQKHLRNAGITKKKFHCLRHTFATNCVNAGVDAKSLSEILGHADVTITLNRYVHPSIDTKRKHLDTLSAIYGQYLGQKKWQIA